MFAERVRAAHASGPMTRFFRRFFVRPARLSIPRRLSFRGLLHDIAKRAAEGSMTREIAEPMPPRLQPSRGVTFSGLACLVELVALLPQFQASLAFAQRIAEQPEACLQVRVLDPSSAHIRADD